MLAIDSPVLDLQLADGMFPLYFSVRLDSTQSMQYLLEAGADVNQRNATNGWTALHVAAVNGKVEALVELLRAGADYEFEDEEGCIAH